MTRRTRWESPERESAGALRMLRAVCRLLPTALVSALVAAVALSASAAAETPKAPKVLKQPAVSVTVEEGQSATFESTASGTPTPTIQWERSTNGGSTWSPVAGATSNQLTIASTVTSESGNEFRAVFKNTAGEATSKVGTLTVQKAPAVTLQPLSVTVEEGQSASFETTASGFPAPTIKWERSINGGKTFIAVAAATTNQLTVASTKTSENGFQYRVTFTNAAGKATTEPATLTVQKAPAVTKQPSGVTVNEGQSASFEATASGFPAPSVQWEVSSDGGGTWSSVEGATSNKLTIASTHTSESGNEYRARFNNPAGQATSTAATLTVLAPPVISEQPAGVIVEVGETAVFEAAASGVPAPTVQWERSTNGGSTWSAVAGATSDQLTVTNPSASENGYEYRAAFTNAAGKATSAAAVLTVATTNFRAFAWGQGTFGQLGDGASESMSSAPVNVSGLNFVSSISAGGRHSLALIANGTVLAWGFNGFSQLGFVGVGSNVPLAVSGVTGVKAIAAGGNHSLALLSNGTVMAWGDNESGQLGVGNMLENEAPVAVKGLTGVRAIAAGEDHSLALMANGTVMAWGENEDGQLGTGTTKSSDVPVAVKGLTGVTAISAGGDFSLALRSDGTVRAWGNDASGQLGNSVVGEEEEPLSTTPVAVETLTGVTAIAAGAEHGLALLSDGTVMAWGEDSFGELGNGTIKASQETPVAVSGLSGVKQISAGRQDSAALLGEGSIMTWGIDKFGTLGNGTSGSPSDVPVSVSGIRKAASVSVGGFHMLAFGEPIPTISAISPKLGPTAGGTTVTLTGVHLTGASAVKFGATPASSFTVTSDQSVEAVAPTGTGTVDITVTTATGTSATGPADRYTYQGNPTVTKLSAKTGPAAGGTSVTITGAEFSGATSVRFGATNAASYTVNSATSITAVSAAATGGTVDVTVTNSSGTSATSTKDHFKYVPSVEGVSPNAGSTAGGTSVTVTGNGFAAGSGTTIFKFGTTKATAVTCASSTSCSMSAPANPAGTINVTALVNKVTSPVNAPGDQFTYS